MRHLTTLAGLAALAAVLPTAAVAQRVPAAAVIVVDTDRVYRECAACRTAQSQLQGQVTALQGRQQTLTTQLRPEGTAIQSAIQALGGRQPDAALRTRVEAFQKRQEAANQELSRGQQNVQSIQANVLRQINERLRPAINQVMAARGANLVVDSQTVLAQGGGLDVTADVLAALNRTLPSVSLTPLPAQAQRPQGR